MVVTCRQMQEAEARLFATGQAAEPLMDLAGQRCAEAIRATVPDPGQARLFCGKGNNGGDALVIGKWLRQWGWSVEVQFSHPVEALTDLARKKLRELQATPDGAGGSGRILVDGLLGIGATGALRGPIRQQADELNQRRLDTGATSFAVDIPSGVDGDSGEPYDGAVVADHTLSICVVKRGVIDEKAINHVGRIHNIPLPEIPVSGGDESLRLLEPNGLRALIKRRGFDTHKGVAGRVSIIAGSKGLTGAAVLSSLGAMHSGAGLITVFVPEQIYPIVAAQAPVEVMVRTYSASIKEILDHRTDVFAIGPGLGTRVHQKILDLAVSHHGPVVMDADLLNWISETPGLIEKLPVGQRLLTPHPGELARLTDIKQTDRISTATTLAAAWNATLLFKGARSVIATDGEATGINSTGTPAMASGGMGDVLTGMAAAFIAQGLSLHDAACLGSWCLGRAAEICPPSVSASRVAARIGSVLNELS